MTRSESSQFSSEAEAYGGRFVSNSGNHNDGERRNSFTSRSNISETGSGSTTGPSVVSSASSGSTKDSAKIELQILRETIQKGTWVRQKVFELTETNWFNNFILIVIVSNTLLMYLETDIVFYRTYSQYAV
jgi:hypothetical protein